MGSMSTSTQALQAIFSRALEQEATARRWAFFVSLALFFAHLLFVAPALEVGKKEQLLSERHERLRPIGPELEAMTTAIDDLRELAKNGLEPDLERLLAALEDDLSRLEAALVELPRAASMSADESAGGPVPRLFEPRSPQDLTKPWTIDDPELLFDLEQATSQREMLEVLRPLVEEHIVRPRFAALDRIWKTDFLPRFTAGIDGLASQVPRLRGRFPEADDVWSTLAHALGNVRRLGQELEIAQPAERLWWSSTDQAGALALRPIEAIRQQLLAPLSLDELAASVDLVSEKRQQLAARLEGELETVQRAMAGSGGQRLTQPDELFAASRSAVALRLFPALLGTLFAAASWWRTRAILALGRAAWRIEADADSSLAAWLRDHLLGGGWRVLDGTFLALLWLAAATAHQVVFGDLEPRLLAWVVGCGAVCVVASGIYRLVSVRAVLGSFVPGLLLAAETRESLEAVVDAPQETPPPLPSDLPQSEDRDTGFLDFTLKH